MNILYVPMHLSLTYISRGLTFCGFVTPDGFSFSELKVGFRAQSQLTNHLSIVLYC